MPSDEEEFEEQTKNALLHKADAIPNATSETLAAHIVLYKALNIGREFAILCMEELARRRSNGDDFEYEDYIKTKIAEIPKPTIVDYKSSTGMFSMKNLAKLIVK